MFRLLGATARPLNAIDDLLKATTKHQVWVPQYTKADGTVVAGHMAFVHKSDDHDDAKVLSGQGTFSQKVAHKKLSAQPWFHALPAEHKVPVLLHHATEIQDKASADAAVSVFKKQLMAGSATPGSKAAAFSKLPVAQQVAFTKQLIAAHGLGKALMLLKQSGVNVHSDDDAGEPEATAVKDGGEPSVTAGTYVTKQKSTWDKLTEAVAASPGGVSVQSIKDAAKQLLSDGEPAEAVKEAAMKLGVDLGTPTESAGRPAAGEPAAKMMTVPPATGKTGPTTFPVPPTRFETYGAAEEWVAAKAKEYGKGKKYFTSSYEYAAAHPAVMAAYQDYKNGWDADMAAKGAAKLKELEAAGLKIGDTVAWSNVGAFMTQHKHEGVLVMKLGIPHVKLAHEVAVVKPGGQLGYAKMIPWEPHMKAPAGASAAQPASAPAPAPEIPGGYQVGDKVKIDPDLHHEHAGKYGEVIGSGGGGSAVKVKIDGAGTDYFVPGEVSKRGPAQAAEPKEGDTKPAADGGTLVLKDGHWVRHGGDAPAADSAPAVAGNHGPIAPPSHADTIEVKKAWMEKAAAGPLAKYPPGSPAKDQFIELVNAFKAGNNVAFLAALKNVQIDAAITKMGAAKDALNWGHQAAKLLRPQFSSHLTNTSAGHSKAWKVDVYGATLVTTYGGIGKKASQTVKSFPNAAKAMSAAEDLVAAKKKGGYIKDDSQSFIALPKSSAHPPVDFEPWKAHVWGQAGGDAPSAPRIKVATPKAQSPATAPPPEDAQPPSPPGSGAVSVDHWKKVGGQGGSNPGGAYVDPDGKKWYVKTPKSEDHVHNEILASVLYKVAGIDAPTLKAVKLGGKLSVASAWEDGLKSASPDALKAADGTLDGFGVDAWLANWDAVGMGFDNLLVKGGKAVRIDVGGSLLFRAQGEPKGAAFGDVVDELKTLVDPAKNPNSAAVFGGMPPAVLHKALERVALVPDDVIETLCELHGPGSASERKKLAERLIKRKNYLAGYASSLKQQVPPAAPSAAAPAAAAPAGATANLAKIPWDKLVLPSSNTNAPSHNKKIAAIKAAAEAGDVAALKAMKFGSNTYGKKQSLTAQTAIAALEEAGASAAAAPAAPMPAAHAAAGTGPKEGDTKQGADGLLVLKNGHWVKVNSGQSPAKASQTSAAALSGKEFSDAMLSAGIINPAKHIKKYLESAKAAAMAGDVAGVKSVLGTVSSIKMPKTFAAISAALKSMNTKLAASSAGAGPMPPTGSQKELLDGWASAIKLGNAPTKEQADAFESLKSGEVDAADELVADVAGAITIGGPDDDGFEDAFEKSLDKVNSLHADGLAGKAGKKAPAIKSASPAPTAGVGSSEPVAGKEIGAPQDVSKWKPVSHNVYKDAGGKTWHASFGLSSDDAKKAVLASKFGYMLGDPDEATSPGVQPGVERSSRNGLLLFDVLTQDFDWRSTTRRGEVGRGPQNAPALQPRMEVPEFLAQQAR